MNPAALFRVASLTTALGVLAGGFAFQSVMGDGEVVTWKQFGVLNNQWGRSHAAPSSYQRISITRSALLFTFNWQSASDRPDDRYAVKGFPAIVSGWHYGSPQFPGGLLRGRLPMRWSENPRLETEVRARRTGTQNDVLSLAWDIWLTAAKPDPAASSPIHPEAEIMVWPWRQHQQPLKSPPDADPIAARLSVWGTEWDLYFGHTEDDQGGWPVLSFVATRALARRDGAIDARGALADFLRAAQRTSAPVRWDPQWWIAGVEFGSEIIQGTGSWTIEDYALRP